MQLSSLLRPEKVKNYQKTKLEEDLMQFYNRCLKVQMYDMGKLSGIVLPVSKAGLDDTYFGGERLFDAAEEAGINPRKIVKGVMYQLINMGWGQTYYEDDACTDDQIVISLEAE